MKMRALLACVLFGAAACGDDCKSACDHAAKICTGTVAVDTASCTSTCQNNLNACKNLGDQTSCVLKAATCDDLQTCPTCLED